MVNDLDYEHLTLQQSEVLVNATMWYKNNSIDKNYFIINGFAGTGKTYLIKYLIDQLNLEDYEVQFCSFTGSSVVNMIRKGNRDATTIHKLIYYTRVEEIKNLDGDIIDRKLYTHKRDRLANERVKLIVVDEYSMIGNEIINDLLSFGVKTIFLGDPGQLEPVKGKNSFMDKPDGVLTEIVRQAADSPIINLSFMARNYEAIPYFISENGEVGVLPAYQFENQIQREKLFKWADTIITATNKTRNRVNSLFRKYKFKDEKLSRLPKIGEKLICTDNNWETFAYSPVIEQDIPLVNGLSGYVEHIYEVNTKHKYFIIDFRTEFDERCIFRGLKVNFYPFVNNGKIEYQGFNSFDFGYAITCHKSQGNQYKNVLVLVDPITYGRNKNYLTEAKWLYTAITRAEKKVILLIDDKYYSGTKYIKSDDYYDSLEDAYFGGEEE